MALYLLTEGADVNRVDPETGNTLLHACVEHDAPTLVALLLLRNGADPAVKNRKGATPAEIFRQKILAKLPSVESQATRESLKKTAYQLTDATFRETLEGILEMRIQKHLADADAQWAVIERDKDEYDKFRARMDENGVLMIAAMAAPRTRGDGIDPKEITRFGARLADGIPEFRSAAAEKMIVDLDTAIWNANLVYKRNDPKYVAVVKRARETLGGPKAR